MFLSRQFLLTFVAGLTLVLSVLARVGRPPQARLTTELTIISVKVGWSIAFTTAYDRQSLRRGKSLSMLRLVLNESIVRVLREILLWLGLVRDAIVLPCEELERVHRHFIGSLG